MSPGGGGCSQCHAEAQRCGEDENREGDGVAEVLSHHLHILPIFSIVVDYRMTESIFRKLEQKRIKIDE
jgi:hypothetical protein